MGSRLRFWSSECPCAPGPNCFPSCAMRCHRSLSCEVPFRHTQPHRIISVNQMALSVRFRLDLRRCRRRSALRSFPEGAAFRSSQSRLLSSQTAGPPLSEIPALPWEVDVPAGLWVPLPRPWPFSLGDHVPGGMAGLAPWAVPGISAEGNERAA